MARRRIVRVLRVALVVLVVAVGALLVDGCAGFGQRAHGPRLARMKSSPEWSHGQFVNPQPLHNEIWQSIVDLAHSQPYTTPSPPLEIAPVDPARFTLRPGSGLRITWFGHSSTLVEIDGRVILTDPIWSRHASPFSLLGPTRFFAAPLPLSALPPIDAVVISHDHYDHLDYKTIAELGARPKPPLFIVPLGVGAHLAHWGVPANRIVELDWWQQSQVGDVVIHAVPARHASGRTLFDKDGTLWAGYAIVGPAHRVYYSGDSGLFPALREIGHRYGPFDATMIEVGQYDRAWPDWHMGPEQAVAAHQMVGGRVFIPVHWGLFALAAHGWTEPVERALVAAKASGVTIAVGKPGASMEPTVAATVDHWWPSLPVRTGEQDPIVSTQMK